MRLAALAAMPAMVAVVCLWLSASGRVPLSIAVPWSPTLGIDLNLYVDALAIEFLLLIGGIGTAVFVYAAAYMRDDPHRGRLFALLTAFMVAMVGCVTVDNILALVVFWELTSVLSFLLVGFKHTYAPARRAAQQALMTTVVGGLALLAGGLLLGEVAGSYSLRRIIEAGPQLLDHPLLPLALGGIFVGAFTKSAQWPFHFWLPNAMAAPTPVSAYLHSATMVKLGIYLLARLKPAFGGLFAWEVTLVTVGAITALWAMVLTLRERDLKRILAWSTVAALGTLVLLIGLPGPGAAEATAAFLLAHALYKAPLFFVAGNVDRFTGTRRIDHLAAMAKAMPWTAAAAALAACSMAGVPLSFGYVAKDLIGIAKTEGLAFEWVGYVTLAVSALTVAVASVAAVRVFWHGGGAPLPPVIREVPWPMLAVPLVVASAGIVLGVVPSLTGSLLDEAARAMLPGSERALVGLVRDDASSVGATAVVFLAGAAIFALWEPLHRLMSAATWLDTLSFAAWYDRGLKAISRTAAWVTSRLQHGFVPGYVGLQVLCVVAVVAAAIGSRPSLLWPAVEWPPLPVAVATAVIGFAALAACRVRDPFVLVLVSGLAGLGTALLAVFLGAPDVAATQFTVEVAFVIIVAAVIRQVRRFALPPSVVGHRPLRAGIAVAAGALVAALVLLPAATPFDASASTYFGAQSLPAAFGHNVVNVILVDFRALDTLGEVVVILATLLAAW
ncbi:MAG: proton-conducting transporter membrane subunit, partial [Acidobacteriota bacterium]|nr:proton-conducting transporter membrane subunit [Acidobacteriota bacterium]